MFDKVGHVLTKGLSMPHLFLHVPLAIFLRVICFIAFCGVSNIAANAQMSPLNNELTANEKRYLELHPSIKVQAEESWPPFNFIDKGQVSGFSNDLIRLVAEKVGLKVEFVVGYQWSEYLKKLKNKEIDVISNIKITPDREKYISFTRYHSITPVDGLLTREGEEFSTDFSNVRSMAVVEGFAYQELINKKFPSIDLMLTKDTKQSVEELLAGNVDAVLDSYDVINFYIETSFMRGLKNTPLHHNKLLNHLPQFMGVHKDNSILCSILDKGLLAIKKTELDELRSKWSLLRDFDVGHGIQNKASGFSSRQYKYLEQHGAVKMCVDPNWLPIEAIHKGKYIGIGGEFVELFRKRLNHPIILVETKSWAETLHAIQVGRCDFIPLISKTPQREDFLSFSFPYLEFPMVLVTHRDNPSYKLEQVLHKSLGVIKGSPYKETFDRLYPEADLREYNSMQAGLEAVNEGEIYGFIDALPVIAKQIQYYYPEMKLVDKFEHAYSLSLAVSHNNQVLLDIFNRVIASISLQQQQQILNHWLPVIYEKQSDVFTYWLAIVLISLLGACLMLLLYCTKKSRLALEKVTSKLESIAMRDYLTGLPNQNYFKEQLKREWVRNQRTEESISLLLIDIDDFKYFNEQYGRAAGDDCIVEISRRLQNVIKRPADLLARYQGEEFIIILPDTDQKGVKTITAEIFYTINGWAKEFRGSPTGNTITVSIGAACMSPVGKSPEMELYRRAERALYKAQDKGFNQMVIY